MRKSNSKGDTYKKVSFFHKRKLKNTIFRHFYTFYKELNNYLIKICIISLKTTNMYKISWLERRFLKYSLIVRKEKQMIQVIIVEDDVKLNNLIKIILERNQYLVDSAYNPNEALKKMETKSYDIIISDIMMPKMDGYEFVKIVREVNKDIPILFITAKEEFEDKRLSYEMGVDDYMVKPIDINELVLRVKALLKRAKINMAHKLKIGNTILDNDSLTVTTNEMIIELPLKEFKILFKLLSYPNKIFTRSQIMNDCWGMYSESLDRTIDVHITHLREKFSKNEDFSIVTVRGLGYKAVINV